MKKLLLIQLVLLALVIVCGTILKSNLSSDVIRTLHRLIGLSVGIVAIASVIFAFKSHLSSLIKSLLVLAALCTVLAGFSGKAAVAGKGSYNANFNKMRSFAIVSVLFSAGTLFTIDSSTTKKQTKEAQDT